MKKTVGVLSATLIALSSLTACGGGDDDATAAKNLKAEILDNATVGGSTTEITDEQAGCIADGTVAEIGVEQLQEYEILKDDLEINKSIENVQLSAGDADSLAGVFVDCINVEKLFEDQFSGTSSGLTKKQRKCITDAIDEDAIRTILAASFQGKQDSASTELQNTLVKCATAK